MDDGKEMVFEFECNFKTHRLRSEGPGEPMLFESQTSTGRWGYVNRDSSCRAVGLRALLSAHTEREAIFAEAMEITTKAVDVMIAEGYSTTGPEWRDHVESLAARWQATTGDATGAEGHG